MLAELHQLQQALAFHTLGGACSLALEELVLHRHLLRRYGIHIRVLHLLLRLRLLLLLRLRLAWLLTLRLLTLRSRLLRLRLRPLLRGGARRLCRGLVPCLGWCSCL